MAARHYELMVILAPDLEERTIAPSLEQFLSVIRNSGGSVEKVDVWGRRRLAYEIDKHFEGIYAIVNLHAEPAATKELDRQLNLNESVLRTKVMRVVEKRVRRGSAPSGEAASVASADETPVPSAPTPGPVPAAAAAS